MNQITRETIRYYDDKPPGSDVVGYMPSRGDFDVEWDNEAERLICDCVFDEKKDTDQVQLVATLPCRCLPRKECPERPALARALLNDLKEVWGCARTVI